MGFPDTFADDGLDGAEMQQAMEDFLIATQLLPGAQGAITTVTQGGTTLSPNGPIQVVSGTATYNNINTNLIPDGGLLILLFTASAQITLTNAGNILLLNADDTALFNDASQGIEFVRVGSAFWEIRRWGLEEKRDPSFLNSWNSHANAAVQYWKDSAGYVQMEGLVTKAGVPPIGNPICTLAYSISAAEQYFPVVNATGFGLGTVRLVGNQLQHMGSGGIDTPILDLSTVRFRQETS